MMMMMMIVTTDKEKKKGENVVNAVVSLYTDGVEQRRRCMEREQTTCVCV